MRIIGTAENKAAVLSFAVEGVHPHDVGTLLNEEGVAMRTGHHCAQPVMQRFDVPATSPRLVRVLQHMAEVDALVAGIGKVQKVFARNELTRRAALSGSDPRPQPQAAQLGRAARRDAQRKASIRCAATTSA